MDREPAATPTASTFGATLRGARERAGLTQAAAATAVGTSQPTLSDWERGRRSPSLDQLARLAHAYGVDFADLLGLALAGASA